MSGLVEADGLADLLGCEPASASGDRGLVEDAPDGFAVDAGACCQFRDRRALLVGGDDLVNLAGKQPSDALGERLLFPVAGFSGRGELDQQKLDGFGQRL